ncbi:MGMT family protein [Emticicia sp. BO119]|uniref:MGMT family protein n=1 Tax=Emticicia sp. BO119 TaxID=2757768 RepID=UPI0015EFFED5|nr:MGMT family protein [Emticicia sp. BO119]MBA4849242.1 MGMT family protein [Emticicia sp. BO119]
MASSQENIFDDIYQIVKLIPKGKVTSYGAIAQYLGSKAGARMVGWAMNACHNRPDVPAHRVVNRNGILSGKHHFGGNIMQERLEAEGIKVKNDQIVNFDNHFWNPVTELL